LLRKIVAAIVLVPLAILIIAFAVANRAYVTVSFDPFNPAAPVYSTETWLFVPIFVAFIVGVLIGGMASWLRHGRWRRIARRLERELADLRAELRSLRRGGAGNIAAASAPTASAPERLELRAPVR